MRDLTTPVTELHTGVSSLDGTVTIEGTADGAKARIDATVLFGKDSAVLRPGAQERIRHVAREFARKGPGKVRVVGYTDDLGPADHGLRLSIRRAGAVAASIADLLPRRGYPMTAVGKGEQDPAVPNTSEANRRKNRRVVITLDRTAAARSAAETSPPAGEPTPKPEPKSVSTSPAATPTASASPSTASASPSPTAETPTSRPTAAAAPTLSPPTSPSATPDVTAPPARAPADGDPDRGRLLDPVVISNLFLVAVIAAAVVLALRRHFRRPDSPDPDTTTGPASPPSDSGHSNAARPLDSTDPAASAVSRREDDRRPGEEPAPRATNAPGIRHSDSPRDLHTPSERVDVEYVAGGHGDRLERLTRTAPAAAASDLDADLRTWFSDRCDLPRLSLLGPVTVRANGAPIARRKPFYTELLAFLALRPNGATPDQVAEAFSLTPARVRNDVKVLRDWLGTNPRTGRRHVPDARDTTAGRARGMAVYQVEGLLVDLDLFDRLVKRADTAGPGGLADLEWALRLVRGRPFDQLRPHGWDWLDEGDRVDLHTEAAVQCASERAADLRRRTSNVAAGQDDEIRRRQHAAVLPRAD